MVTYVVLLQLYLCHHFWTFQSIHMHFAAVKHCSCTVTKVCNGCLFLVQLQPTKTDSCSVLFFGAHTKWRSDINKAAVKNNWSFTVKIATWWLCVSQSQLCMELAELPTKWKFKLNTVDTFWLPTYTEVVLHFLPIMSMKKCLYKWFWSLVLYIQ